MSDRDALKQAEKIAWTELLRALGAASGAFSHIPKVSLHGRSMGDHGRSWELTADLRQDGTLSTGGELLLFSSVWRHFEVAACGFLVWG